MVRSTLISPEVTWTLIFRDAKEHIRQPECLQCANPMSLASLPTRMPFWALLQHSCMFLWLQTSSFRLFTHVGVLRGVMRMTLTVVVIMFELMGALTYILLTMVRVVYGNESRLSSLYNVRVDRLVSNQVCWWLLRQGWDSWWNDPIQWISILARWRSGIQYFWCDSILLLLTSKFIDTSIVFRVMRRDLITLDAKNMTVRDLGTFAPLARSVFDLDSWWKSPEKQT